MPKPILALQLYSLRREFEADAEGTLRKVRGLGYENVEFAGSYGWSIDRWQRLLAELGLKVVGAHAGEHELTADFAKTVEFQKAIGNHRYIVPWLPDRTAEAYKRAAAFMNKAAKELREIGGEMLYHNHNFEFDDIGGTTGYEILMKETDPALVKFEVDTFWVEYSGMDAAKFLQTHADRIGIIHAKEIKRSTKKDLAVGQGDTNWPPILKLAGERNWPVVVEYEGEGAIEVCKQSADFLNAKIAEMS